MANAIPPKIQSVENMVKRARDKTRKSDSPACPTCHVTLWYSAFFDGTGNNRERDFPRSHSNIAALFDTHIYMPKQGIIRRYYEGLGTPFEFQDRYEKRRISAGRGETREIEVVGYKEGGESTFGLGFAAGITERLEKAAFDLFLEIDRFQSTRRLDEINLSAFGFSRGATEARAFVNWIASHSKITRSGSKLKYDGIPLNVKFLGVFDTVESVGWAAANKMPELIKTAVPAYVQKCSHIVAAHELRHAFPLTMGDGATRHVVYPGAHADVGGGYSVLEQGRPNSLARVALLQMLDEARGAGLKMMSLGEMKIADEWEKTYRPSFDIPKSVKTDLSAYLAETKPAGAMQDHIRAHMNQYWAWIDSGLAYADTQIKLKAKPDAANQKALRTMAFLLSTLARTPSGRGAATASPVPGMVPAAAQRFFSTYVHDAFEHFSISGGTVQKDVSTADYYTLRALLSPTA
ncbi:MAG: hypothetical protein H6R07_3177 [Proteobacteria bacterium]|nr:hypothetical protein [Pseudomonadota bacterium]